MLQYYTVHMHAMYSQTQKNTYTQMNQSGQGKVGEFDVTRKAFTPYVMPGFGLSEARSLGHNPSGVQGRALYGV